MSVQKITRQAPKDKMTHTHTHNLSPLLSLSLSLSLSFLVFGVWVGGGT